MTSFVGIYNGYSSDDNYDWNDDDDDEQLNMSGYHADTPITIKAEANPQSRQPLSLIFMSTLYNVS